MNTEAATTQAAVHCDKIGQIAITVRDLAISKNFYQNLLGMTFLFDAGSMSFFQCGEIRFMIGTSDKPVSPASTIIYFRVDDIEEAYAQLMKQGVASQAKPHLVARMPDHDLWMAILNDPDDNTFALMSEIPRAKA